MKANEKIKFTQILNNNPTYPVLIKTEGNLDLDNMVKLPTETPVSELIVPTRWNEKLLMKGTDKKIYLCIENIDKISAEEQEKFIPLIKDKRAGNFKLPNNVQIVISAKDFDKVAAQIKKFALFIES